MKRAQRINIFFFIFASVLAVLYAFPFAMVLLNSVSGEVMNAYKFAGGLQPEMEEWSESEKLIGAKAHKDLADAVRAGSVPASMLED